MPRPKVKHEFDEVIEARIIGNLLTGEYENAKANRQQDNEDFEVYVDLLDANRPEKEYDWMSDIHLPEFFSHVATQMALDVAQYFKTRDFVEVYIEDEGEEAINAAKATKELINRTLNQKHLYHYFKFVRGKLNNHLSGDVYAHCWWEQKTKKDVIGIKRNVVELPIDVYGDTIIDRETQVPAREILEEEVLGEVPVIDRFNYEILDPRNVFTDNKYVYSLQQKDFVTIRSEKTLQELKQDKEKGGYFNLHLLEEIKTTEETETSRETYNKDDPQNLQDYTDKKVFDILKRYGKYWAVILEKDADGYPIRVKPGIDSHGKPRSDAEFIEMVLVFAKSGSTQHLIAFHATPYLDSNGVPYKPVIRGLCYIHPTKDSGMGDGKYAREISKGIDDTFNVSNDRVMLATLPTMKGSRHAVEDNSTIYFEPQHTIELENPADLEEFKISDDIQGALAQIQVLTNKMDQAMAVFPTTMGDLPGKASTTATAVVGAEGKTNNRTNYKSMTFEYTFLIPLYWMIQQMTYTFAKPETGVKLMGNKVSDFNPDMDYTYKPLSQSIESEQSKLAKLRMWDTILSRVIGIQHPDTVHIFNYIFNKICELMGDEYVNFAEAFLGTDVGITPKGQGGGSPEGVAYQGMPSNQYGVQASLGETATREAAGAY